MISPENKPGFQRPFQPVDAYMENQYREYGFEGEISLEAIEAKATELLTDVRTIIAGAELVLNRRIDATDRETLPSLMIPGMSGEDRFAICLMQRQIEYNKGHQSQTGRKISPLDIL